MEDICFPAPDPNRRHTVRRRYIRWAFGLVLFLSIGVLGIYCAVQIGFSLPEKGHAWPENAIAQHTTHQNYTVCLKPNDSFADLCQPEGRQYITSLTDVINLDFGYTFTTDTELDYDYTYEITGRLMVYDKDFRTKEIFIRDYDLLGPELGGERATKMVDISQSYALDFQRFNREAIFFKDKNALGGETMLLIEMKIDLDVKHGSREISRFVNLNFSIPLTKQTYHISLGAQPDRDDLLEFAAIESSPFWARLEYWIMGGVIVSCMVAIVLLKRHFALKKSPHERFNAKIRKEYGRVLVDLSTPLEIDRYKHRYRVESFDDLLNKADRTMQNILCFKISNTQIVYVVVEGDAMFLYSLGDVP